MLSLINLDSYIGKGYNFRLLLAEKFRYFRRDGFADDPVEFKKFIIGFLLIVTSSLGLELHRLRKKGMSLIDILSNNLAWMKHINSIKLIPQNIQFHFSFTLMVQLLWYQLEKILPANIIRTTQWHKKYMWTLILTIIKY